MRIVMVVVAIVVASLPVTGQSRTAPKTPWGDPDLQGFWPSVELLSVPLERPVALGKKAMLTEEEFARLPKESRVPGNNDQFNQGGSRARLMEHGTPQRQTSLIVDPPDGRLPPLTAEGARRVAAKPALTDPHNGPEDFSGLERCVSRGALGSMLPVGNTNGTQIIQAPGWSDPQRDDHKRASSPWTASPEEPDPQPWRLARPVGRPDAFRNDQLLITELWRRSRFPIAVIASRNARDDAARSVRSHR